MYDAGRVIKDAAIKVAIAERLRILLDTAVEDVKNTEYSYVNDVLHYCMVKQEDYDRTLKADENAAVLASKKWAEANGDANDSATILFNTARDPNNILSTYCLGVKLLESKGNFVGISILDFLQLLGHLHEFELVTQRK